MTSNKNLFTLLNLDSKNERIEFERDTIQLRIVNEINSKLGDKKMNIAEKLGYSKSYITQLFRGDKKLNLDFLAKLQIAYREYYFKIVLVKKDSFQSEIQQSAREDWERLLLDVNEMNYQPITSEVTDLKFKPQSSTTV